MPNITITLDRMQAVDLYNMIDSMTGTAPFKATRQGIQKDILKAWPEATAGDPTPAEARRELALESKHQRALAEGFLGLAESPSTMGRDFKRLREIAQACRLWGWVEQHIRPAPEFEGELDGEPALVDPVA